MDLQSVNHAWSSKGLQNNFNIYNEKHKWFIVYCGRYWKKYQKSF